MEIPENIIGIPFQVINPPTTRRLSSIVLGNENVRKEIFSGSTA